MTARQKIENLTNSWYGFDVFLAVVALLKNGIGLFSLFTGAVGLLFSFLVTWFLGRRLIAKSSLWRLVMMVFSVVTVVASSIGTAKMAMAFMSDWSLSLLVQIGVGVVTVVMNAKSFRVLTDSSVRAYFG
jgi:hypothetical protein